jgi:peptidyl-prolyl cis-trans isomerase C
MRLGRAARGLAAAAFALAACPEADPVILRLGGERVRRSDFERHLAAMGSQALGPVPDEARRGLLDAFLEERALVIEARGRGLVAAGASPEEESRAVSRLLAEAVSPPEVTEAEIESFFRAHAAERALPETVSLRQVLVPTLNEARDVKRRLVRNPRSFDAIARSESRGPEAAAGGYMGRFERGQLPPELEAAAFALPAGATSEPVASALGYHVLRVESRQPARARTQEEAREGIRHRIAREKRSEAERAFVAGVLARSKVNHEAALRARPSP